MIVTVRSTHRARGGLALLVLAGVAAASTGCYAPQLLRLQTGLDSLRTVVDTLQVRDAVAYQVISDTRRDLQQQRDLLLSSRASSGSTLQELFDNMSRLEGKLDEVMHRFQSTSERQSATPGGTPAAGQAGGPDPAQVFDQATLDLTQGRYALALQGYRDFLRRFPAVELSDNAQYGAGECFFAQAAFDSAAVEYARVGEAYPKGDRMPAALYKLALCQERLGRTADSKQTLQDLVKRFPNAGESQLARDRLGAASRR